MKILIGYVTKRGTTEKVVQILREKLSGDIDVVNLKTQTPNVNDYDAIIVGGSVYYGNVSKEVKEFCMKNKDLLKNKKTGIFLCCGSKDKFSEQLYTIFPKDLLDSAIALGNFGYEYNFDKMSFFEKLVIKRIVNIKSSKSEINEKNIAEFAEKFI